MKELLRGILIAVFAFIPARYLSRTWYDDKTDPWQYDISWFVIFLAMYLLASYLTRPRFPQSSLKL